MIAMIERFRNWNGRNFVLVCFDILMIVISAIAALWLRFDLRFSSIDPDFLQHALWYLPIGVVCTILLFYVFHFYSSLWEYCSIGDVKNILIATFLSGLLQFIVMKLLHWGMPRSYTPSYFVILFLLIVGSRFLIRVISVQKKQSKDRSIKTMIVGAGQSGNMLLKEIKGSQYLNRRVMCLIDDDVHKVGTHMHGIPVVGTSDDIPRFVEKYDIEEIILAMPSATNLERKRILEICNPTGCKVLTLPGIYQIVNSDVRVSMLRSIDINDLLGREPVDLHNEKNMDYVRDQVVLVTGGGGSIGSEICRQIAFHAPQKLIIFDIYENNAYDIQIELREKYPELDLEVLIGSVRNQKRVDSIFETYHPDLVFHAAAHKHVPLMEDSPNEAIKNNVLGTWVVAQAAHRFGAKKMVLISTDKAVRPTNVMGASKRICELIVQSFAQTSKTEFAAVRFGNVLGSNGSVVPLFRRQIAGGGPVTVTHPDILRYFMTIPEAVALVLQCGALAKGGEIFILDMGEPVKILDLAINMIRLSGLEPYKDIQIVFTGLRPGEKLVEELLISLDNLKETENSRIFVAQQPAVDVASVQEQVEQLVREAFDETADIRTLIENMVSEYHPQDGGVAPAVTEAVNV